MNELTGAFSIAREKGEDPRRTKQSLFNAGYTIQEIEEAYGESEQTIYQPSQEIKSIKKNGFKKKTTILFSAILIILLVLIGILLFVNVPCEDSKCTMLKKTLSFFKKS